MAKKAKQLKGMKITIFTIWIVIFFLIAKEVESGIIDGIRIFKSFKKGK